MLTKYATIDEILEVKTARERLPMDFEANGQNLAKFAKAENAGEIEDGFLYVRARAISSRVNKNNDGWPSEELSRAYSTFVGRPVFVDHNNSDPKRTRGVIVDAKLHVEDEEERTAALDPYYAAAPDNHKPPTWVEILIEVDAETYPKLAKSIQSGDIDAVSMGANIDRSICSVCTNEASVPAQYCDHISSGKGATFEITADNGEKVQKTAYEDCYGVNFFEISFVFDPADPTADAWLHEGEEAKIAKQAAMYEGTDNKECPNCGSAFDLVTYGRPHGQDKNDLVAECNHCGWKGELDELAGYDHSTVSSMQKGAPYPENSDKNAPDHSPPGQKLPKKVNSIYNACIRENKEGGGEPSDSLKEKCMKIAWAKYKEMDKGSSDNSVYYEGMDPSDYSLDPDQMWGHAKLNFPKAGMLGAGESMHTKDLNYSVVVNGTPIKGYPANPMAIFAHYFENGLVDSPIEVEFHGPDAEKAAAIIQEMRPTATRVASYNPLASVVVDEDWSHLMRRVAVDEMEDNRNLNHTPQADETTAPQKVDTLRDDVRCPNCESDDLGTDPDGILRCPTCGYEQPPEGLDNPDLDRAKDFDDVQKENEQRDDQGNRETPVRAGEGDTGDGPQDFIQPVQPMGATKTNVTTEGISDMIWKRKVKTNDVAEARAFHASTKTAASAQITPGGKQGIHNGTHGAFRQAKLVATVEYPQEAFAMAPPPIAAIIQDNIVTLGIEDANPMKDMFLGDMSVKALGLSSKADIPITVTSDNLEESIALIQQLAGAEVTGAVKNGPVNKEVVLPGGERKGDEPKDAKVIEDQLAPVEADRRVIKREEHPDGRRTEQIVEETGELGLGDDSPKSEDTDKKDEAPKDEPKKDSEEESGDDAEKKDTTPDFLKKKEPAMASASDGEKRLLAAFQVAEDAVELGIIANSHKMAFVAQLEKETLEQIEVRRSTLAMVKSAGLVKRTIAKGAGRTLPKIASHGSNGNGNGSLSLDDIPIEAIFFSN